MPIASRVLTLKRPEGDVAVPIRIFAPEQQEDGAWSCRYEIGWPEGEERKDAWGADAVQALVIALGMIGAELYASAYHKSGKLLHEEAGKGYGFPVPASLRHLLEGDDAKYF
jgi:hypothetical protein